MWLERFFISRTDTNCLLFLVMVTLTSDLSSTGMIRPSLYLGQSTVNILYCTVLCMIYNVLYWTVLYCTLPYYTILYCTLLFSSSPSILDPSDRVWSWWMKPLQNRIHISISWFRLDWDWDEWRLNNNSVSILKLY